MAAVLDLKIPVWLYRVLAVFPVTGMAGVDHYAVGSTQTAFAKGLINLITFGSWYFYDILQSLDAEKIATEGLKFPFYEGGNIGAGRLATSMTGLGKGGESLLNLLFTSAAALLYGVAILFENKPAPVGTIAKAAKTMFGSATVGLAGYTAYNAFKGPATAIPGMPAIPGMSGMSAIPGMSGMSGISAIPGMSGIPAIPGMPKGIPSVSQLAKMVGGGAPETKSADHTVGGDFIAIGLLFLFAISGFTLSAVRNRSA
jgi:hypothetical protein